MSRSLVLGFKFMLPSMKCAGSTNLLSLFIIEIFMAKLVQTILAGVMLRFFRKHVNDICAINRKDAIDNILHSLIRLYI